MPHRHRDDRADRSTTSLELRRRARRRSPARRRFEELDVDSLDLAELSQIVESEFGVELTSSDVADVKTVGDAIDLVVEPRLGDDATIVITGVGAVIAARRRRPRADRPLDRRRESACATARRRARDFDPGDFLSVKEARRADRFTQLALAAAGEAVADAGWAGELPYDARRGRLRDRRPGSAASSRSRATTRASTPKGPTASRRWRCR